MSFVQRRLAVALVLATLVGSGVLLLLRQDRVRSDQATATAREAKLLACDEHGKVVEVSLHTPQQNFVIVRTPEAPATDGNTHAAQAASTPSWTLAEPPVGLAETLVVEAIVDASCSLARKGWALAPDSNEATPLSAFNLETPPYTIELRFGDNTTLALAAGDKHPFDESLAVRTASCEKGVALVDGAFLFQLNKDLLALRDKRLVHHEPSDMVEVSVVSNEPNITPFVLRRDEQDNFTLTTLAVGDRAAAPSTPQPADADAASNLLAAISTVRAKSFVNEKPEQEGLTAYGLMRPRLVATVKMKDAAPITLKLGRVHVRGEDHLFAQALGPNDAPSAGPVVELPSDYLVDKLVNGSEGLRDLRLFHVAPGDVHKLVLHEGAKTLSFVRRATSAEEGSARKDVQPPQPEGAVVWHLDEQPELAIEQSDVDGLIYRALHLRAESQPTRRASAAELKRYGLVPPYRSFEFFDAQMRPVATLNVGTQEGNMRYVTDGHQEVISRIFATTTDDIDMSGHSFAAHRRTQEP